MEVKQLPEMAQQQRAEATQAYPWGGEGRGSAQPARTGSPRVIREPRGCEGCEKSLLPTPHSENPPPCSPKDGAQTRDKAGTCVLCALPKACCPPPQLRGLSFQAGRRLDLHPQSLRCNEGIDRLTRPQGGLNPKLN